MNSDKVREQIALITNYLGNGGFFNPELMEHDKVRDMVMGCRDTLQSLLDERIELETKAADRLGDVLTLRAENQRLRESLNLDMDLVEHHDRIAKYQARIEKLEAVAEACKAENCYRMRGAKDSGITEALAALEEKSQGENK